MKKSYLTFITILGAIILLKLTVGFAKPLNLNMDKALKEVNDAALKEEVPVFPGYLASDKDFVYYLSTEDFKIYRIDREGKNKKLLSRYTSSYSGILLNGDWIYFVNLDKGERLFRVKTDGSKEEAVSEGKILGDYEGFFRYENVLYFHEEDKKLQAVDLTGNERMLSEKLSKILSNVKFNSVIYKGFIYNFGIDGIYRINLINGNSGKINGEPVFTLKFYGESIYFINYEDHLLYKSKLDGSEAYALTEEKVMLEGPDFDTGRLHVSQEGIYYISYKDDEGGSLCRMRNDGSGREVLAEKAEDFVCDDNYIYFITGYDAADLIRLEPSSASKKLLAKGDFAYCVEANNNLVFYGIKSTEEEEAFDGRIFVVKDDGSIKFELK